MKTVNYGQKSIKKLGPGGLFSVNCFLSEVIEKLEGTKLELPTPFARVDQVGQETHIVRLTSFLR
jgi:hypothetical protein